MNKVNFKPLDVEKQKALLNALNRNVNEGTPLWMGRNTCYIEKDETDLLGESTISAVKSVPCHY